MALYKLAEDTDYLFESIDFILENTDDALLDSQYKLKDSYERRLLDAEKAIKKYEAELKNTINSKPRSWLERKLVGLKQSFVNSKSNTNLLNQINLKVL